MKSRRWNQNIQLEESGGKSAGKLDRVGGVRRPCQGPFSGCWSRPPAGAWRNGALRAAGKCRAYLQRKADFRILYSTLYHYVIFLYKSS
jgi:hypothetical protein